MSEWAAKFPPDSPREAFPKAGDRVVLVAEHFEGQRGTVLDAWRSSRGYERPGIWYARVQLDRGPRVSCRAAELRLKMRATA